MKHVLCVFIMAFSAGCTMQEPSTSESASASPQMSLATRTLDLSGCHGAGTIFSGPTELYPGPKPPGWERTYPINSIYLQVYECKRFSFDRFERGPLRILFEFNGDFDAPAKCLQDGDFDLQEMLTKWWVNDQEVADYLAQEYGAPAKYGTIESTKSQVGEAKQETWSWNLPGAAISSLNFYGHTQNNGSESGAYRLFWFDATSLHYMDLAYEGTGPGILVAHGTLKPPMLYPSKTGVEAYSSDGGIFTTAQLTGPIKGFRDYRCNEPI